MVGIARNFAARIEARPSGPMPAVPARPPTMPAFVREATALDLSWRSDAAIALLAAVALDARRNPTVRAQAALEASTLASGTRSKEALYWCIVGLEADPGGRFGEICRAKLLLGRGNVRSAVALSQRLAATYPNDARVAQQLARALERDARSKEALAVGERALALCHPNDGKLISSIAVYAGYSAQMIGDRERAIAHYRTAISALPGDTDGHFMLAALVHPRRDNAQRRRVIEHDFERANSAFQRGSYREVARLAQKILLADDRDGLAHAMYASAKSVEQASRRPLVVAVDAPIKRRALIRRLETVADAAKLFPDWPKLTELQKATVAASTLAYAKALPQLIAAGSKYRLPGPGTPSVKPGVKDGEGSLGTHGYGTRGIIWRKNKQVVTGLEIVEGSARGEDNVIAHELGHLLHYYCKDLARRKRHSDPLSRELAKVPRQITRLYKEARAGRDGQKFHDSYAATNELEYFAQGMMSYLCLTDDGPMRASQLERRNPKLWRFCARIVELLGDYPSESPAPQPARARRERTLPKVWEAAQKGEREAQAAWRAIEKIMADQTTPWPTRHRELMKLL